MLPMSYKTKRDRKSMAKRNNKTAMISARVTRRLKQRLMDAAETRGETEAMIMREALTEYFQRRESAAGITRQTSGSFV